MTKASQRILQQEELIFDVTQLVAEAMQKQGVTKAELATRLGKSRSFITQLLDGTANMTLKTVADVFTALNLELSLASRRPEWAVEARTDAVRPLAAAKKTSRSRQRAKSKSR